MALSTKQMWKAERKGQAVEECVCLEDYGGKDFECVHKKSRGFFLPEYARLESVRVFLFSVGQRGRA